MQSQQYHSIFVLILNIIIIITNICIVQFYSQLNNHCASLWLKMAAIGWSHDLENEVGISDFLKITYNKDNLSLILYCSVMQLELSSPIFAKYFL